MKKGLVPLYLTVSPSYLKNGATDAGHVVDYKDWQITLSRRFRAIKLWVVMKRHGVEKLREMMRGHVKMAALFETLVKGDDRFEVVVPRTFGLVCFRLYDVSNEVNSKLLEGINERGRVYMTHAVVDGMFVVRLAVGGSMTQERHVVAAWKLVQEVADRLLHGVSKFVCLLRSSLNII